MLGNIVNLDDFRVLAHENDGPEIRFINNRTGDVYYKKLTDQECMNIAYYFHKLVGNYFDDRN